jgi:hypothetical protein
LTRRARRSPPGEVLDHGRADCQEVEAIVGPERPVLGRGRRVQHQLGHVGKVDDAAILALESGQLDGARAVIDDGRLGEREGGEVGRVRQVASEKIDDGRARNRRDADKCAGRDDHRQHHAERERARARSGGAWPRASGQMIAKEAPAGTRWPEHPAPTSEPPRGTGHRG